MAGKPLVIPTYSHGGSSQPKWPAVPGNSISSGRPIQILGSHPDRSLWPTLVLVLRAGTCHVLIEANGCELDGNGNPTSTDWVDVSNGGYDLAFGGDAIRAKRICPLMPYYRTRITSQSGADLVSYVPMIVLASGQVASASYPNMPQFQAY